jgi:hypothetical protein
MQQSPLRTSSAPFYAGTKRQRPAHPVDTWVFTRVSSLLTLTVVQNSVTVQETASLSNQKQHRCLRPLTAFLQVLLNGASTWIFVINAMIYKKIGALELDELRVIHLFEAAFTSEEAFLWVLTAPFFLFKDSVLFCTESDNLIKNPTIIRRLGQK